MISNIAVATIYIVSILISERTENAFIIAGDFNPNSNNFDQGILNCNVALNIIPTRKEHILGLIRTNIPIYYNAPTIRALLDTPDHSLVLWKSKGIKKSKNDTQKIEVRPIQESSLESFGDCLRTYQWESAMCNYSSNEKWEHFTQVIDDKIEYYFSKRIVKFHVEDKPFRLLPEN